ncbi:MAG: acetolactate decarboxylase [Methanothrix sp.]|nr:acetolactate decarboxylase [Methanothrix sp.]
MTKPNEIAKSIALAMIVASFLVAGSLSISNDTLFQTSTIGALMNGLYDGTMTFKDLGSYGDFGIGTFEALDGEMVGLDGQFYQVKSDGVAYIVNDSMKTPFAEVTFFEPEEVMTLNGTSNLTKVENYLDSKLVTKNIFYAIKIDGTFDYIKTRSVPAQKKPYPTLSEAVKGQKVFEFTNVSGTLVGFRCPDFVKGVNVPGYHMHFITRDRSAGGHLLDFALENASVMVDNLSEFEMDLPNSEDFYKTDLSIDQKAALEKVESDPKK